MPTGLTRREREVRGRLGEGLPNAWIGARHDMAEGTVKTHVSRSPANRG
ncbi:LuxR C-terminal-related transcriptional regulator [Streptomyces sp. AGS-58]